MVASDDNWKININLEERMKFMRKRDLETTKINHNFYLSSEMEIVKYLIEFFVSISKLITRQNVFTFASLGVFWIVSIFGGFLENFQL